MKIIKFPEKKIKNKWRQRFKNADKNQWANFIFSLASLGVGLAIVWFILHKMNL